MSDYYCLHDIGNNHHDPSLRNTHWSLMNRVEVAPQPSAPVLTNIEYNVMYTTNDPSRSNSESNDFQMQFHDRSHNDNLPVAVPI